MAQKVLILGDSGTGKSASLRNFTADEILVINAAGKPLPFKNHFEVITPSFERLSADILKAMDATKKKVIVVDDAQYILSFPMMRRIKESGWDKWNDIQGDFFTIIKHVDNLPADTIVYFLSHLQRTDDGHEKIKTVGKMLDEKITIEGLFTTVLKTAVNDGTYVFLTQNSGMDTVKSPIGMFDSYAIDNDLKYVDTKIRNYYEIGDYVPDEAVAELDVEAAKPEVVKPDADGRRRRNRSTEPKVDDSVSKPAENLTETEDRTTDGSKRRTRKVRNGENKEEKPEEAPAEEEKKEEYAGAKAAFERAREKVASEQAEEGGKRRRRRKANTVDADDFESIPDDISDDEVPF